MAAKAPHDASFFHDNNSESDDEPVLQEYSNNQDSVPVFDEPPRVNRQRHWPKVIDSDYIENHPDALQQANMFSLNLESS